MSAEKPSFLELDSPADRELRIFGVVDEPGVMVLEIDTVPSGTIRLKMGLDDAKKISFRLFAAAKKIGDASPARRSH